MKCLRCTDKSTTLYCGRCRLHIIEKKIRKQSHGMFKHGERVLADPASAYYASQIPYIKIVYRGNHAKKLVPATIDTKLHSFLGDMFSGKIPRRMPALSLFATITNEELSFAAGQRGLKVQLQGLEMLDKLEKKYPGVKNSFSKCINIWTA